ncbi:MAG: hypothetical protein ACR2HP_14690 [Ilumatobacteraceae bacterium]
MKKRDEAAEAGWDPEDHPRSVRSGRTNDEVAAAPAATWSSEASWVAPTVDELAALDDVGAQGRWTLGAHTVSLAGLDDVLAEPLTRRDLVRHLTSVAPAMLPYLCDRAVELHRFPRGVEGPGSWQRTVPSAAPSWLTQRGGRLVVDSPAALAWAAGRSTFELCASTSTTEAPDRPTWAILRVDPGAAGSLDDALIPARLLRTALEHLGLDGRPVLVGSAIEVRVPIAARWTHERVRAWVDQLAGAIAATVPDAPAPRALDGSSFVAPFCVLPAPGAPVVVPLGWDELDDPDLRPDRFTVSTIADRLARVGDPLAPLIGEEQRLPTL